MLSGAMIIWFILTGASLIFTILDFRHTPISWVQKLAWALVIAYTGPVGLFVYLLACRKKSRTVGREAKILKKSRKNQIDPKITFKIWKSIIGAYIDYEFRNFKKK